MRTENETLKDTMVLKFKELFGLNKVELGSVQSGELTINFEGDELAEGLAVTHEVDGEQVAVPDGTYELDEGGSIEVAGGSISAYSPAEEEEPEMMSKTDVVDAITKALEGFAEVMKEEGQNVRTEFADAIMELEQKFSANGAEPDKPKPNEDDGKEKVELSIKEMLKKRREAAEK